MDFPGKNLPLPHRPFPFDFPASALPAEVPDCHLVRTAIPCLPSYDSLGVFHRSPLRLLASFARMVSEAIPAMAMAIAIGRDVSSFPHTHSRQATLHTAHDSVHRIAGSYPNSYAGGSTISLWGFRCRTILGLHGNRVGYSMPLECARDP